jgi:hypothetical protein
MQMILQFWLLGLIGAGALFIGLTAIIAPGFSSQFYGVKSSGTADGYIQATGARDLLISLLYLYAVYEKDLRLGTVLLFVTAVVSFSDFLITNKRGSKKISFLHLAATVALIGTGGLFSIL